MVRVGIVLYFFGLPCHYPPSGLTASVARGSSRGRIYVACGEFRPRHRSLLLHVSPEMSDPLGIRVRMPLAVQKNRGESNY